MLSQNKRFARKTTSANDKCIDSKLRKIALRCIISNDAATPLPATSPTAKKRDWAPRDGSPRDHFAVVPSNRAKGLVAMLCFPVPQHETSGRQKLELNLRCQIQVFLMVRPFGVVEVIETESA